VRAASGDPRAGSHLLRMDALGMSIFAIGIVAYGFDLPLRRDERLVVPDKAKA
jgi:hypothetical protein